MKKTKSKQQLHTDRRGYVSCRVCYCTEDRACSPPCSWAEDDLCSTCARAIEQIKRAVRDWLETAYDPKAARLFREVWRPGQRKAARARAVRGGAVGGE